MRTVISLFETREDAREVVEELVGAGFERDEISIVSRSSAMARGAAKGVDVLVASLSGLLTGATVTELPELGQTVVAGPVSALVVQEGTDGPLTLSDALERMGIPEEEAGLYAEGVRRDNSLVVARVQTEDMPAAQVTMRRHRPIDVEQKKEAWCEHGWDEAICEDRTVPQGEAPATHDRVIEEGKLFTDLTKETEPFTVGVFITPPPGSTAGRGTKGA